MASAILLAYYKSYGEVDQSEHKTARFVGKTVAALIVLVGLVALYVLSTYGALNSGPFAWIGFNANLSICGILGSIELITFLGLGLGSCGFGKEKQKVTELVIQDQEVVS